MQIESLKVFCDLAETSSFTKAAEINAVTQSAVSQQISNLENKLGATFIERSKKKFSLTKEGEALYKYSKQIVQTYDELYHKIQENESHRKYQGGHHIQYWTSRASSLPKEISKKTPHGEYIGRIPKSHQTI